MIPSCLTPYLLLFILSTFSVLSIAMPIDHSLSSSVVSSHNDLTTSANLHCCERDSTSCSHGEQCDCGQGQSSYSLNDATPQYSLFYQALNFKSNLIFSLSSQFPESPLRPPIILI